MSLPYVVDPSNPRAPTQEHWDRMTPEERARVVASLPPAVQDDRVDLYLDASALVPPDEVIGFLLSMLSDAVRRIESQDLARRLRALGVDPDTVG